MQSLTQEHIVAGSALIVEGGGQRGIFGAGILDSWLKANFNPFQLLIGTSAGAQNISAYLAGQHGYAKQCIQILSRDKHFFNVSRRLIGKSMLDLDWYFAQTKQKGMGLDLQQASRNSLDRHVLFTATRATGLIAEYHQPQIHNWFDILKASSALPFLYSHDAMLSGRKYFDGGVAAPLPVKKAYELGARKIVVIRSTHAQYQAHLPALHHLKEWFCQHGSCPAPIDLLDLHEQNYRSELEFINHKPHDAEIIQIFPTKALESSLIGSHLPQLERDYQHGASVGKLALKQLKHQFTATMKFSA
ncbi:patatin family protein [Shewanella sp. NIFS-20-20]|uniref:patatin-like phospholipase family protein n=1 Tax=Shewanella sp. NIFS-20-20 TaxID=2853806 RepID=UPI001C453C96|nr:patatin family protein [Shewanella sp. NIFS-20-20]MBV7316500.1 patatin family protein [Shewanella sp. NIFS-20-20]